MSHFEETSRPTVILMRVCVCVCVLWRFLKVLQGQCRFSSERKAQNPNMLPVDRMVQSRCFFFFFPLPYRST